MPKFRQILKSAAFDGLVGLADWTILETTTPGDDDLAIVRLRVLPKPIPGCVRTSGMADQVRPPTMRRVPLYLFPTRVTR